MPQPHPRFDTPTVLDSLDALELAEQIAADRDESANARLLARAYQSLHTESEREIARLKAELTAIRMGRAA